MLSLTLACLWAILSSAVALTPNRWHWPAAYALIAVGIPILGFVTLQNGPVLGLLALAGGISILRWPARFFGRWMLRQLKGRAE